MQGSATAARRRGGQWAATVARLLAAMVLCMAHIARGQDAAAGGEAGDPRVKAEAHLDRAEKFRRDAVDLYRDESPLAIDAFYLACREAWDAIWSCPESADVLAAAGEEYARGLEGLLSAARRHGRLDGCRGLVVGSKWDPVTVPIVMRGYAIPSEAVIDVVASPPPGDRRVSHCYQRWGFGLPVVVRTVDEPPLDPASEGHDEAGESDPLGTQALLDHDFLPPRQSLSATAVLRFAMPGEPAFPEKLVGPVHGSPPPAVLDLVNPVEVARLRIGPWRPPLAADLTSPLLDILEGMPKRASVDGFLQPLGRHDTMPRLEMLEPYVPGKIPVVFVHGLASDEGTWFEMINHLRAWPQFHRWFTPWVYHYPTGAPFLPASSQLRQQLTRLVRKLDPTGQDPALTQLVVVGHSMGGLHAKMMVVQSGNHFWNAVSNRPYSQVRVPEQIRESFHDSFFFEPLPFVRRVVFIATPHGGSAWATRAIGRTASAVVQQPRRVTVVHDAIIGANPPGTFKEFFEQKLPTTIDTLEPQSPLLNALHPLPMAACVTAHTVVGTGYPTDGLVDGDGVVSVPSARLSGVVSELFVPAKHTQVHHQPQTVAEVVAILTAHAADAGKLAEVSSLDAASLAAEEVVSRPRELRDLATRPQQGGWRAKQPRLTQVPAR
jgi:pimeloyl-ACP methyl ester carboxylesterase